MCPERRDSPAFIEPDVFVELPGQHNFEVVAGELAFGPIDHPNGPLKPRLQETFGVSGITVAQLKHKMRRLALVAEPLHAFSDRRPDIFDLHGAAPLGGSRHSTVIGARTNRIATLPEFLVAKLPDIVLTTSGHSVASALPMWELCAQTMPLLCSPWYASRVLRVLNMCSSRKFHDAREP